MFKKAWKNPKNQLKTPESDKSQNVNHEANFDTSELHTQRSEKSSVSVNKSPNKMTSPIRNKSYKDKNNDPKASPLISNSFFRNLLQKRENQAVKAVPSTSADCVNEVEGENTRSGIIVENEGDSEENVGVENEDERLENDDLDILVSCLSDDEEPSLSENELQSNQTSRCDEEESNDSIYNAATDVDSVVSSEHQEGFHQSQDLFGEEPVVSDSVCQSSNVSTHMIEPGNHQYKIPTKKITSNDIGHTSKNLFGNNNQSTSPQKMSLNAGMNSSVSTSEDSVKITVEELFPDLDSVDEAVVAMLPKELQLEVEKVLKEYKAKSHHTKSGIRKYFTSVPSPRKDVCASIKEKSDNSLRKIDAEPGPSRTNVTGENTSSSALEFRNLDDENNLDGISDAKRNLNNSTFDSEEVIECEKCGLSISVCDMPVHIDYHMALSLHHDIRKEAQSVVKKVPEKHSSTKNTKNKKGKKRGSLESARDLKMQKLDSFLKS